MIVYPTKIDQPSGWFAIHLHPNKLWVENSARFVKFFKAISLATSLVLSTSAFSATWKIAVGDGGGSAQEALVPKHNEDDRLNLLELR